jgi:hypothetical protein
MILRHRLLAALLFALPLLASAQRIEGLPIKPGDTVEAVQAALQTDLKPVESQSATRRGVTALRLQDRGIWVFFDNKGVAYVIRLDAPFAGDVGGVKIGSTRDFLIETLGQPGRIVQVTAPGEPEPYIYYLGERTARFNFDRSGVIETMLIVK